MALAHTGFLYMFDRPAPEGFLWQEMEAAGCKVRAIYPSQTVWGQRIQRRLHRFRGAPRVHLNVEDLDGVHTVIIGESEGAIAAARRVRQLASEVRILHWYWNPIKTQAALENARREAFEVWTFDVADAERYGLGLNTQFFFSSQCAQARPVDDREIDLSFIGRDKGRSGHLGLITRACERDRLATEIRIVPPGQWVPYRRVIDLSARSKAVLDIVQEGQTGMTLRAMEALFLGAKLVTDNRQVLNEQAYPRDLFVFIEDVHQFHPRDALASLAPLDEATRVTAIDHYDFPSWLARF